MWRGGGDSTKNGRCKAKEARVWVRWRAGPPSSLFFFSWMGSLAASRGNFRMGCAALALQARMETQATAFACPSKERISPGAGRDVRVRCGRVRCGRVRPCPVVSGWSSHPFLYFLCLTVASPLAAHSQLFPLFPAQSGSSMRVPGPSSHLPPTSCRRPSPVRPHTHKSGTEQVSQQQETAAVAAAAAAS